MLTFSLGSWGFKLGSSCLCSASLTHRVISLILFCFIYLWTMLFLWLYIFLHSAWLSPQVAFLDILQNYSTAGGGLVVGLFFFFLNICSPKESLQTVARLGRGYILHHKGISGSWVTSGLRQRRVGQGSYPKARTIYSFPLQNIAMVIGQAYADIT